MMKIKYIITALTIGFFTVSSVNAQEKKTTEMEPNHVSMTKQNDSDIAKMDKDTYACSMHPEITSDKAGKCSKCGMTLVKSEMNDDAMAKKYACSMHPDVTSDQPGDCSKCGMILVEQKMEKKSEDDHKGHEH